MSRSFFFIFFINIFLNNLILAQAHEIVYKVKVFKNTQNLIGVSDFTQAVFDEMDSLEMRLVFNKNKSIFKPLQKSNVEWKKERIVHAARSLIIGVTHSYFYNPIEAEYYQFKSFLGNEYIVKSTHSPFNWKLLNEQKIIQGHQCNKAITHRKRKDRNGNIKDLEITAWYTSDFPYPFGPKDYFGLPGVILELHEGSNRFSFFASKITIDPLENVDLIYPNNAETITEEDFDKIVGHPHSNK